MTWADRLLGAGLMVVLSVVIVFAITVLDSDPPATSTQVEQNQAVANCRAEVSARFDAAFALVALAELNGGEYPQDAIDQLAEQGVDLDELPTVAEAREDLIAAAVDKARLSEVCPPP